MKWHRIDPVACRATRLSASRISYDFLIIRQLLGVISFFTGRLNSCRQRRLTVAGILCTSCCQDEKRALEVL
jgi:hypothetical protein